MSFLSRFTKMVPRTGRTAGFSLNRPAFLPTVLNRSFSAATISSSEEKPVQDKAQLGVLEEYGVLPVVGFTSFILLSKEYVIINEELLLAAMLTNTFFGLYVMLKEPVAAFLKDYGNEIETSIMASYNRNINTLQEEKQKLAALQDLPEAIKNIEEYKAHLETLAVVARAKKNKAAASVAVTERLERIAAFEGDLINKRNALLRKIAGQVLVSNLTKNVSVEVQDKIMADSIAHLMNPSSGNVKALESVWNKEMEVVSKSVASLEDLSDDLKKRFASDIAEYNRQKGFVDKLVNKDL